MTTKARPEEILDEEHEKILQRVCAIDVTKDSGKVCLRVPAQTGTPRRGEQGLGRAGPHQGGHRAG